MNVRDAARHAMPAMDEPVPEPANLDASELFRRHAGFVAGFVRHLGIPAADCADLVQDVFLIVHRKGGYVVGSARPTTWLANIALGEVRNLRRKRSRRRAVAPDSSAVERAVAPAGAGDPEGHTARRRQLELVSEALDELDEDKRIVFILYEIEGESCDSIAAGLGIPTGTVYSRLHAARHGFRATFARLAKGGTP